MSRGGPGHCSNPSSQPLRTISTGSFDQPVINAMNRFLHVHAFGPAVSDRAFLPVGFPGLKVNSLADTGASVSGISTSAFLKMSDRASFKRVPVPRDFKLTAAAGSNLQFHDLVELPIQVGDLSVLHRFLIIDNLCAPCILGMDFLKQHNFVLDCGENVVRRGKNSWRIGSSVLAVISAMDSTAPAFTPPTPQPPPPSAPLLARLQSEQFLPPWSSKRVSVTVPPSACNMGYCMPIDGAVFSVLSGVRDVVDGAMDVILLNNSFDDLRLEAKHPLGSFHSVAPAQANVIGSIAALAADSSQTAPPLCSPKKKEYIQSTAKIGLAPFKQQVLDLLLEFHDVVSESPKDLGGTDVISHHVRLDTDKPIHVRQFPLPYAHEELVLDYVNDLLARGVIEPSTSAYNCPIFCVPKPKGGLRIVQDFRALNVHTFDEKYIVRTVQSCIDKLGRMQARIFSSIDLRWGFWQQNLHEDSRQFSAFTVPGNLRYQWKRTPMGMCNSSHSFARLMDYCFRGVKSILGYIDDLLCASKNEKQHLMDLREAFSVLRRYNLKVNLEKCTWMTDRTEYLGFHIGPDGISPSQSKTKAIAAASPPANIGQIRQFVGLANYFRHLIPNYQKLSSQLTCLLRKDSDWKSGELPESALKAFRRLQHLLTSGPVVAFPRPGVPFRLAVDASQGTESQPGGLGAVVTQVQRGKERLIACASRGLKQNEKNYSAFLLELAACVWGIEHFHTYTYGPKFVLCTDHKPIESLSKVHTKTLNRLQELMNKYDFVVEYKKGVDNTVADYLSRNSLAALNVTVDEMLRLQCTDEAVQEVVRYLSHGALPGDQAARRRVHLHAQSCYLDKGLLYYKYRSAGQPDRALLWAPALIQNQVLDAAHCSRFAGHGGRFRTHERVLQRYWWPGLSAAVDVFVGNCAVCQKNKHPYAYKSRHSPQLALEIPKEPNVRVHIDLFGPLATGASGKKYVLVITDAFTKYADVSAIASKEADVVAAAVFERWISRFSPMVTLVSDRGREFANAVMTELCGFLGVERRLTAAFHPQTNASAETFNRTLSGYLRAHVEGVLDWECRLPALMLAYNTQVHKSTLQTPFFLTFLHDPRLPFFDLDKPRRFYNDSWSSAAFQNMQEAYRLAYKNNSQARAAMLQRQNERAVARQFAVGDQVLVYFPRSSFTPNPKLHGQWLAGFFISRQLGPYTYEVCRGPTGQPSTVHVDRLRLFRSNQSQLDHSFQRNQLPSATEKLPSQPSFILTDLGPTPVQNPVPPDIEPAPVPPPAPSINLPAPVPLPVAPPVGPAPAAPPPTSPSPSPSGAGSSSPSTRSSPLSAAARLGARFTLPLRSLRSGGPAPQLPNVQEKTLEYKKRK